MQLNTLFKKIVLVFVLIFLVFFLAQKINLINADIGRHIKSGEIILSGNLNVLDTCFYSYTHPHFPTINHHWLSGVIFFLIWKISGFIGLSSFYIILYLITFLLFFNIAKKQVGFKIACLLSLFFIPLIADRTEVRPEIFSYLFSGIFLWILWHIKNKKISFNYLFILPLIQVIWVNTHIYFVIGPGLLFLFLLESLYKKTSFKNIKKIIIAFLLVILVLFLNPFGLEGVIYPFKVFENFGYRPIENQSIWFLGNLKHFYSININLFKIAFFFSLLSFIGVFFKDYKKINLTYLILWLGFSFLSWTAIRNFAIFSLFSLPIISYNLSIIFKIDKKNNEDKIWLINFLYLIIGCVIVIIFIFTYHNTIKKDHGIGLKENNNASIDFFKSNNIKGPIFNNYDIGGYLIYNLFPEEKVFVDNRPESYPNTFFKDIYIPIQNNEKDWQKFKEKYKFNVIFFSYKDATPWAQKFLINRIDDNNWAPVFVDDNIIIFLKNNKKNQDIINKYKLPRSMFNIISYK